MNRKPPKKDLRERAPGIAAVVALHVGLAYVLVTSTALKPPKAVDKDSLLVTLVPEQKPEPAIPTAAAPPPPVPSPPAPPAPRPPAPTPPAPKPPPQPRPAPARADVAPVPPAPPEPPAPAHMPPAPPAPAAPAPSPAPVAAPAPAPAPAPAAPANVSVELVCSNYAEVQQAVGYPSRARRQGLEGTVVAEFNVSPSGAVENLRIASASSDLFTGPVLEAMRDLRCKGQGMPVRVRVPFSFRLN